MKTINISALIEVAKSFARFIYFGVLGLIVAFLTGLVTGGTFTNAEIIIAGQTINIGFIIVAGITTVIKFIDKYKHENENDPSNGIAPNFLQK